MERRRRVLILGLDGGTFDLLDPYMAAGELPYLRWLSEHGLRAPLRSVYPPKTIPAWYSFATGMDPGGLGIFGFTEPDGGPGKSRLVQTFRPAEAFWDALSRQGLRVGILNFPLRSGYPLNGFVVPGMMSDSPPTFPKGLREELETALGATYPAELPPYRDINRTEWMRAASRSVELRGRGAAFLAERYIPDFLFVLFRETDRVEHQHWSELTGPLTRVRLDLLEFWRAVDRACAAIDRAFRAGPGPTTTLVVSDHGHGPARSDFFTNRWLVENGFLVFRDPTRKESLRRRISSRLLLALARAGPIDRMLRPLADLVRGGNGAARLGNLVVGDATFESMADKIDWKKTVAFSYPVPEGIYLNRYNPDLTPERGARVVREIRRRLEAYPGARIEVYVPSEIYHGQHLEQAPALLLKIDGMQTDPRMDFSYPEPVLHDRPGFFYGTGTHRMDGILIASGDGVAPERRSEPFSLIDIAPTVLESMGVTIPPGLPGRSFGGLIGGAA